MYHMCNTLASKSLSNQSFSSKERKAKTQSSKRQEISLSNNAIREMIGDELRSRP